MSSNMQYDYSKLTLLETKLSIGYPLKIATRRRLVLDRACAVMEVARLFSLRNGATDPNVFKKAEVKIKEWNQYCSKVDTILGTN